MAIIVVIPGWSDVPLTAQGRAEAKRAGKLIQQTQIQFTDVHTSLLKRAITTADIVMDQIQQDWLPIHKTWRLNERHYGALRGQNKDETRKVYGAHQVALWRRSFKAIPPLLKATESDRRYVELGDIEPRGESLEMAYNRLLPYWTNEVAPRLLDGHNQLVVAHGSTLRALIKYLEEISDEGIDGVEVANGEPIVYQFDDQLKIINKKFLD